MIKHLQFYLLWNLRYGGFVSVDQIQTDAKIFLPKESCQFLVNEEHNTSIHA